jgi:flavin-dependent dehydrogenase
MANHADVVIAGGGPAGLATAIAARLEGLDVVVLDRAGKAPVDKACGEGLMPDGVEVLQGLGVDVRRVDSRPFRGIRYIEDTLIAEGKFPGQPGVGIRRTVLHDALAQRAQELGVDVRWGVKVDGLRDEGFETDGGLIQGRRLVGADGRSSRIRGWSGLSGRTARRRRFGVRRHFEIEPWTDKVEVYWADGCEAYVTPVGDRLVGVALLWYGSTATFAELLARFPQLETRLADVPVASKDRGAGPLEQRCSAVVRGNLALVGDASGYVDAITGEGLALSFHQARALVDSITAGDLGLYVVAHRRIGRYPNAITRLLLLVEGRPRLRRRVMRSLAADPSLMSRFLALKMRADGPRLFGSGGLLPLAAAALRGGS